MFVFCQNLEDECLYVSISILIFTWQSLTLYMLINSNESMKHIQGVCNVTVKIITHIILMIIFRGPSTKLLYLGVQAQT